MSCLPRFESPRTGLHLVTSARLGGLARYGPLVLARRHRHAFTLAHDVRFHGAQAVTDRPELLSRWFVRRLPFQFKVPDYVDELGAQKRYSLTGARLLEYPGNDVAYLTYRMNERPISLLVASSERITPQGGKVFRTAGLDFHFSSRNGLRLITWNDRALSYALVSDLNVTGAQSFVICHGSAAERRKIERLPQ